MQARIWENIQADEAPPPVWLHRGDEYDGLDTQPIAEFVQVVLAHFSAPYPTDITDQVCLAIEKNPDWLERYNHLIEHFSSQGKDGKSTVNTSIGQFTKQMTGMITLKEGVKSKSTLMKSYSKLGYKGKP